MFKTEPRANLQLVNKYNKIKVVNIIREFGPVSRAGISPKANISSPTVTRIVRDLIKEHLVIDLGLGPSADGGGRPPLLLDFNAKGNFVIGIDLGTTQTVGILSDLGGGVISEIKIPTNVQSGQKSVMEQTRKVILDLISNSSIDQSRTIRGIGIGVAGLIDRQQQMLRFSPDFGWHDVDVREEIEEGIPYPIVFDNVTRVMVMGELCYGAGRNYRNFICVNIGYGIGAGIVVDKHLLLGERGMAGEFGHITLVKNGGPQCDCGNSGCLEALSSGHGIARAARSRIEQGEKSILKDMVFGRYDNITAELVFKAAHEDDHLAKSVVQEAAEYIGIGISTLINVFNTQAIVIGGGVAGAGQMLFDIIKDTVKQRALPQSAEGVDILPSKFGTRATVMGAIALVLHEILKLNMAFDSNNSNANSRPFFKIRPSKTVF
ncbi:MAG: ROK family transcriptional regulator [bacterium]|nr:ROK family transcriptional regulator [Candidatus Sumerlaeota bacterium]